MKINKLIKMISYLYLLGMILCMTNGTVINKILYNYNFTNYILITILATLSLIPFIFTNLSNIKNFKFVNIYLYTVLFDIIRSSLSFIILGFMSASTYTLLRMLLELIFSALFQVYYNKNILSYQKYIGLFILSIGSCTFILPDFINKNNNINNNYIIGIGLTIIRCISQVIGSHFEIKAMSELKWTPGFLIGAQALGSFILELPIAIIIVYTTSIESWNTDIWNDTIVIPLLLSFLLIYVLQNLTGQLVQREFSQLVRNIGKTYVPLLVWIEMTIFKYEDISMSSSYYKIIGAMIYIIGGIIFFYNKKPLLILILGGSGVGKDTLITKLFQKYPNKFIQPKSYTTRSPRPIEYREIEYIDDITFDNLIKEDKFISYLIEPYGKYGIQKKDIKQTHLIYISQDYGEQSMRKYFNIKTIYIMPCKNLDDINLIRIELYNRIIHRKNTENINMTDNDIQIRIDCSINDIEIAKKRKDLIFVYNDFSDFEKSFNEFEMIVNNLIK